MTRTLHAPRSTVELDGDARTEVVAGQAGADGPGGATWGASLAPPRPSDGREAFETGEAGANAPHRRRTAARHRRNGHVVLSDPSEKSKNPGHVRIPPESFFSAIVDVDVHRAHARDNEPWWT